MSKEKREEGNPSKISTLFGLADGDEFQVKGHINHLFRYNGKEGTICNENEEIIPAEVLLQMIEHPEDVVNHGAGRDILGEMSSMTTRFATRALFFLLAACVMARIAFTMFQASFTWWGLIPIGLFALALIGAGVCGGMICANLIYNKEAIINTSSLYHKR